MNVYDEPLFMKHRQARLTAAWPRWLYSELFLPALLFGSVGGITWAIRGTTGWGGMDGTLVPGMTWGILWYYVCWRRGIDARGIAFWLGFGIALGGMLGYGQYVSWIRGEFSIGDSKIPIAPGIGYAWFVLCGIGWGAPGGIFLGWALAGKKGFGTWAARLVIPIAAAFLGRLLVHLHPAWFFPHYEMNLYAGELNAHLKRTVETNTQNFTVVAWWMGAMLVALVQRDRRTLVAGVIIGGGFGPGFCLAALWCLGYVYAPGLIDWWKMWELNAGFNLGVLYILVMLLEMRRIDKAHRASGAALSGVQSTEISRERLNKSRELWLTGTAFVLFSIIFFGATSRLGVLLGLYNAEAVGQYQWPAARILLFLPACAVILALTARRTFRILRFAGGNAPVLPQPWPPERISDLIMFIGIVGAVTIWPSKIGVFYALFLWVAIFALNRLHRVWANTPTAREDIE